MTANRWSYRDYFFAGLRSAIYLALATSIPVALWFHSLYGADFQLGFFHVLPYLVIRTGVILLALCLLGATLLFLGEKLFNKTIRKPFALVFSGATAIIVSLITGFAIHAGILRYSKDALAYTVNGLIILSGFALFLLLYRIMPAGTRKTHRLFGGGLLLVSILLIVLSGITPNPLAKSRFTTAKSLPEDPYYRPDGSPAKSLPPTAAIKPNIILLSIDTLRSDSLGCYGNPHPVSPAIDRLAGEGALFSQALAQSSWTLPSHMTMITSLYPSTHGCTTSPVWTTTLEKLPLHWITMAEVLRHQGYATAAFTDGPLLGPAVQFDQGFTICDDSGGGISAIIDKSLRWLKNRDPDVPFFLFLHCYDVHNYTPPEEYVARFVRPYRGKLYPYYLKKKLAQRVTADAFYHLEEPDLRFLRTLYEAAVRYTDDHFARLVNHLRDREILDQSLLIVTSDHGEEFWEHGGLGHGWSLYQHQLKIPLIIRYPRLIPDPRRITQSVGIIDIAPTVLDLIGLPSPVQFEGSSLKPLLTGRKMPQRAFLAEASHLGNQKCLIDNHRVYHYNAFPPLGENLFLPGRALYVWRNIVQADGNELYDLNDDPDETRNQITVFADSAAEMKDLLLLWCRRNLSLQNNLTKEPLSRQAIEQLKSLGYINQLP